MTERLNTVESQGIDRLLAPAVLAGMLAAGTMGLFLMLTAAAIQRRGILTPVYEVAALVDPDALAASRHVAQAGVQVHWVREPFIFGVGLHLVVGALLGMGFWLIARALKLRDQRALIGGVVYGLAVMLVMAFAVLPGIAAVLGPDSGVNEMPNTAGWPLFALAHVVFGLVLGYWIYRRPEDVSW